MKTSNRIRSNRSSARTSPQVIITRNHKPQIRAAAQLKTERGENSIAVFFFDNGDGISLTPGIDLTSGEFQTIVKDAYARGETLNDWLLRTFEETPALRGLKPRGENIPPPAHSPSNISPNGRAALAEPGIEYGTFVSSEPFTLTLFDHHTDNILAGASISPAQLAAIKCRAKSSGQSIGSLLQQAVDALAAQPARYKIQTKAA